ncbi:MAG: sulfatase-like hydrolase/transferase, partial [Bacteroidales bacterium]|nr:sulfatase-like hydrolase/transferase [Bacteroidales bacterium]
MRKGLLIRSVACSVCLLSFISCTQNSGKLFSEDPVQNVIVIIGDDHSTKVLGSYGNEIIQTPNLDKLASEGIRFSNAYSNAPLCSASRQSILTGKYPHSTGVTLLRTPFRDEGNTTVAEILRKKGFRTGMIGKAHFNNYLDSVPPDHGFEYMWSRRHYLRWFDEYGRIVPDSVSVRPEWKPFQDPARIWLNAEMLPGAVLEG